MKRSVLILLFSGIFPAFAADSPTPDAASYSHYYYESSLNLADVTEEAAIEPQPLNQDATSATVPNEDMLDEQGHLRSNLSGMNF